MTSIIPFVFLMIFTASFVESKTLFDRLNEKTSTTSSIVASSPSSSSKSVVRIPTAFKRSLVHAFLRATGDGDWFRNLQLLGKENFVDDFMSIRDPRLSGSGKSEALISEPDIEHEIRIQDQVDEVFGRERKFFGHSKIGQKLKRKLTKLLTDYTQCPVVYKWNDLGERFWPRYIRTGTCSQKKSCSFPSGMGCKPAEESHLTLLRKFCGSRRWGKAEVEPFNFESSCRFISIKYPIVTKCSCSC